MSKLLVIYQYNNAPSTRRNGANAGWDGTLGPWQYLTLKRTGNKIRKYDTGYGRTGSSPTTIKDWEDNCVNTEFKLEFIYDTSGDS
jgi:hypothetical protein